MNTAAATPSVTSKIIGPQEADNMLASYKYEHQRKTNKGWVTFLAEEMKQGTFDQSTTIRIARLNGNGYLIDGQHRLRAVVESNLPQRFIIVENKGGDSDEIADLYTRIDQGRNRKTHEKFQTLDLAKSWGLLPSQVDHLGTATRLMYGKWMHMKAVLHQDEHLTWMLEYLDAYRQYLDVCTGALNSRSGIGRAARRASTTSVALVTFHESIKEYSHKVDEFWEGAIHDDGIMNDDPRKAASQHLRETGMLGGNKAYNQSMSVIVTPAYSARYLARCFNAYVQDKGRRSIKRLKPNEITAPMLILGSSFNGK